MHFITFFLIDDILVEENQKYDYFVTLPAGYLASSYIFFINYSFGLWGIGQTISK
jgi:hypothetical protein